MIGRAIRWLVIGSCFAAPVGAGLFRVWVNQDTVLLGYAMSEVTTERRELQAQRRELEVELAAETSPENLARIARRLGLRRPTANQVLGAGEKTPGAAAAVQSEQSLALVEEGAQ